MDKLKENTNIYPYVNIHTHNHGYTYIHTDTHMYINTLFITQVRKCFLTCLKLFKLFAFSIESGKLFHIEGPI